MIDFLNKIMSCLLVIYDKVGTVTDYLWLFIFLSKEDPHFFLDDANNLVLRMQLAGIDGKDIDIQVTRESATISSLALLSTAAALALLPKAEEAVANA
jgi:hypothetical protein